MANLAQIIGDLVTDGPALVSAISGVEAALPGLESKDVGETIDALVQLLAALKPLAIAIADQEAAKAPTA